MKLDQIARQEAAQYRLDSESRLATFAEQKEARLAEIEHELTALGFALRTPLNRPSRLIAWHPVFGQVEAREGNAELLLDRAKSAIASGSKSEPVVIRRGAHSADPSRDVRRS